MSDRPFIIGEYAVRHRLTSDGSDRYSGVLRGLGDRSEKTVYNTTPDRNEALDAILRLAMKADSGFAEVVSSLSGDATAEDLRRKNARIAAARRLLRQTAPSVISEDDPLMRMCEKMLGYVQSIRDEADIRGGFVPTDTSDDTIEDAQFTVEHLNSTISKLRRENDRLTEIIEVNNKAYNELRLSQDRMSSRIRELEEMLSSRASGSLERQLHDAHEANDALQNRVTDLSDALKRLTEKHNSAVANRHEQSQLIVLRDPCMVVTDEKRDRAVFTYDAMQEALESNSYSTNDERVDCALTEFVTQNYGAVFDADFPLDGDPTTVNTALNDFTDWIRKASIDQGSYKAVETICEVALDDGTPFDIVDIGYATSVWCGLLNPKGIMQAHAVDGVSLAISDGEDSDLVIAVKHLLESV